MEGTMLTKRQREIMLEALGYAKQHISQYNYAACFPGEDAMQKGYEFKQTRLRETNETIGAVKALEVSDDHAAHRRDQPVGSSPERPRGREWTRGKH